MATTHPLLGGAGATLKALADLLMPPLCVACKAPTATALSLCAGCWAALPALSGAQCDCCGLPLPLAWAAEATCLGCLNEPPDFDAARAAYLYAGPARDVVLAFKNGREAYAPLMAAAMLRAGAAFPTPGSLPGSLVVPVPLHRWRLLARGYNQAAVLAREISRLSGASLEVDLLVRHRNTPLSRGLRRDQRRRNVAGAFRIAPARRSRLEGARVILVDDVMTSGATASACARVLRRAGATRIDVLTYARVAATDATSYLGGPDRQDDHGQG